MKDSEVAEFVGRTVRVKLTDGRLLAGTLQHATHEPSGKTAYAVVSGEGCEGDEEGEIASGDASAFEHIWSAEEDTAGG